ncbi:DNA-binding HxlR family transcriptional regulator [Rhodococcus erythropolis]|nr:DNA-binding HxlR family transcriptional regulator [Rhodococcus erythropolis]MCW2425227.1 DNA-binding HxlR family transcriptional regulator [Rhodococcus erythropolis]
MHPTDSNGGAENRSPSQSRHSIAKALDIVGTRSAALVLYEAYRGITRFSDFANRIGMTGAVTAVRLRKLTSEGLLTKRPYRVSGQRTRYEYVLTVKGSDLLSAILMLEEWGSKHLSLENGCLP